MSLHGAMSAVVVAFRGYIHFLGLVFRPLMALAAVRSKVMVLFAVVVDKLVVVAIIVCVGFCLLLCFAVFGVLSSHAIVLLGVGADCLASVVISLLRGC